MKKFYESPVVEITVFDVEDVITASAGGSTNAMTDKELSTLISDIQADYTAAANTEATVGAYSSYTW